MRNKNTLCKIISLFYKYKNKNNQTYKNKNIYQIK